MALRQLWEEDWSAVPTRRLGLTGQWGGDIRDEWPQLAAAAATAAGCGHFAAAVAAVTAENQ